LARAVWQGGRSLDDPAPEEDVRVEEEIFCEPPEARGWGRYDHRYFFVRNGPPYRENALVFPGSEEPVLVHLRGRGFVQNVLDVGLDGERVPLLLQADERLLALFVPLTREGRLRGVDLLPIEEFDVWLALPPGHALRFSSAAERIVVEFELGVHRYRGPRWERARRVRLRT
jgi:hypothetical protein